MQGREREPWPFLHMVGVQPMPEETMQPCSDPLAWICKKFSCCYLDRTCHFQLGQDLTQHAHLLNMLSMFSFSSWLKFQSCWSFAIPDGGRDEFVISRMHLTCFYLSWRGNIRTWHRHWSKVLSRQKWMTIFSPDSWVIHKQPLLTTDMGVKSQSWLWLLLFITNSDIFANCCVCMHLFS